MLRGWVVALATITSASDLCAQLERTPGLGPDSVTTTPDGRYPANGLHRLLLGSLNRDLWSVPVPAPVLDLGIFAGGLTPLRRGGGLQTQSLRLRGQDGQTYNFRSIDKDATRGLDPMLQGSLPARVLQDQIGALFPLSAMVVAPLLEAAGVLHPNPRLVVLPDDERLGEFREDFAGLLGWLEIRPDEGPDGEPGFAGSTRVVGSPRLLERLEESSLEQVDAQAYLRARLLDVFVGDWDRHPDQWRWASFERGDTVRWYPIPRDRDWALSRLNGALVYAAGRYFSHYRGFGPDYEPAFNATFTGRALDRRILTRLDRADFLRTAEDLQQAISDEVIAEAVGRLPASYQDEIGPWLIDAFTHRRDRLVRFADEYYVLLAGWVDLYGTDEEELALVERTGGGATRVRMYRLIRNEPSPRPYVDRTFSQSETREIRIFLQGDEDRVEIRGPSPSNIVVRAIGGGGDDSFVDESPAPSFFHDHRGDNDFTAFQGSAFDEEDWDEPPDQFSATHQSKARDWGSWTLGYPLLTYNSDEGFYLGAGFRRDSYGFRHYPYERRLSGTAMLGPAVGRARGSLRYDFPVYGRGLRGLLDAYGSRREVARFFGFGNDAQISGDDDFYKFTRDQIRIGLQLTASPVEHLRVRLGPRFLFVDHDDLVAQRYIGQVLPYGLDRFAQFDLEGGVAWDRRDHPLVPRSGWLLEAAGRLAPSLADVETTYGGASASARWYTHGEGRLEPLLGLRVGGERTWGTLPYHTAAYLGGPGSNLGVRERRFLGDAVVHAGATGSIHLTPFYVFLPGKLGIHAISETGRVWLDGDSPGGWHWSHGGGIWLSFVNDHTLVSFTIARSDDRTGLYFGLGWPL